MWKLSREASPPAPPPPPAPALPPLRLSRPRFDGSGTVSSALATEAMAPIRPRPTWPVFAIAAALVFVVLLALALRG
jgi:hypothetical protein